MGLSYLTERVRLRAAVLLLTLTAAAVLQVSPAFAVTALVINTNATGPGSLAAAVNAANADPNVDKIEFAIPGDGPHRISTSGATQLWASDVLVDGFSQPGSGAAADGRHDIRIHLDALAHSRPVFSVLGSGNTIQGMAFVDGNDTGLAVYAPATVRANFIGTDGTSASNSLVRGLHLLGPGASVGASSSLIGGSSPADTNWFVGEHDRIIGADVDAVTIESNNFGIVPATGAVGAPFGYGVGLIRADDVSIASNNFVSGYIGVRVTDSFQPAISFNTFGLALDGLSRGDLTFGVNVRGGSEASVTHNRFATMWGLTISQGSADFAVDGNSFGVLADGAISGGHRGMLVAESSTGVIGYAHLGTFKGLSTGIAVTGAGTRARILGQIMSDNLIDIDLNQDGPTPNDAGDTDSGPNDLLNTPSVTVAEVNESNGSVRLRIGVDCSAGSRHVEIFRSPERYANGSGSMNIERVTETVYCGTPKHVSFYGLSFDDMDDWFSATATSDDALPVTSEVSMAVQPPLAPVAIDGDVATNEDTGVNVVLSSTDRNNSPRTYAVEQQGAKGSVSCTTDGNCTYTPNPDANGTDSFMFRVTDSTGLSDVGTATVSIGATPDAPVADSARYATDEDVALPVTLAASDPDGETLTYAIADAPTLGAVTCTGADCTYTPHANRNGSDSFTFTATDPGGLASTGTIDVDIIPVNDAPVFDNLSPTTDEDRPTPFTVMGHDPDGDALTYSVTTDPTLGTVSCDDGSCVYYPAENANGSDVIGFTVTDPAGLTGTGTVTITIAPVNDAPVADDQYVTTDEEIPVIVTLTGTDVEGDAITFELGTEPEHGTVTCLLMPECIYLPDVAYSGVDSFTFTATDPSGASTLGTIYIDVGAVNDAPIAEDAAVSTPEDVSVDIDLVATDEDDTELSFEVTTPPSHGTLTCVVEACSYTPNADFNGTDSFVFRASDDEGAFGDGTVTLDVAAVNDMPKALDGRLTIVADTTAFTLSGTDVEDAADALTFEIMDQPNSGLVTCNATACSYARHSFASSDTFTYKVTDSAGGSDMGIMQLNMNIPAAPVPETPFVALAAPNTPDTGGGQAAVIGMGLLLAVASRRRRGRVAVG